MARETKISRLRRHAAAGEWEEAISIASRFPDLGEERGAITRAQSARRNPAFYRQIGRDPDEAFAEGIEALRRRYQLEV